MKTLVGLRVPRVSEDALSVGPHICAVASVSVLVIADRSLRLDTHCKSESETFVMQVP